MIVPSDYFQKVAEAIEFLMALGSLLGIFGLLYAIASWFYVNPRARGKLYSLILVSLILISICGLYTGIKYFRI